MNKSQAFAPSNIALVKYWGKRDDKLNLPVTNSLSISLGSYGTQTQITEASVESYSLNKQTVEPNTEFYKRLKDFLDRFRPHPDFFFNIETESNIPIAAGIASSASGFAAVTLALNDFFDWKLEKTELSRLARLGSGSACRSLWQGFVEWEKGSKNDGTDSVAHPIDTPWESLQIGLLLFNTEKKAISSREAMKQTVLTSPLYKNWPQIVENDLNHMHKAIETQDFTLLGRTAESNAIAMHNTMLHAQPSIIYSQPETLEAIKKIIRLREEGLEIYFTQDAGANLKVLFLRKEKTAVLSQFPGMVAIDPWKKIDN